MDDAGIEKAIDEAGANDAVAGGHAGHEPTACGCEPKSLSGEPPTAGSSSRTRTGCASRMYCIRSATGARSTPPVRCSTVREGTRFFLRRRITRITEHTVQATAATPPARGSSSITAASGRVSPRSARPRRTASGWSEQQRRLRATGGRRRRRRSGTTPTRLASLGAAWRPPGQRFGVATVTVHEHDACEVVSRPAEFDEQHLERRISDRQCAGKVACSPLDPGRRWAAPRRRRPRRRDVRQGPR